MIGRNIVKSEEQDIPRLDGFNVIAAGYERRLGVVEGNEPSAIRHHGPSRRPPVFMGSAYVAAQRRQPLRPIVCETIFLTRQRLSK
jgi:hypothetical protein